MSKDEQMLIVGRVTTEYAETRKKLAALFSEVDRYAHSFQKLVWYLQPQQYSNTDLKSGGKPPDLSNFPTVDDLNTLIREALETLARKRELHAQLKEFGAEPKD